MNRKRLAVAIGLSILFVVAALMLWPDNEADQIAEETSEEVELPEGLVLLGAEQIEASQIVVETVGLGSVVELVFPATVAASPTASARIDARAAGVVRSVGKTLGDYVRQGETIAAQGSTNCPLPTIGSAAFSRPMSPHGRISRPREQICRSPSRNLRAPRRQSPRRALAATGAPLRLRARSRAE